MFNRVEVTHQRMLQAQYDQVRDYIADEIKEAAAQGLKRVTLRSSIDRPTFDERLMRLNLEALENLGYNVVYLNGIEKVAIGWTKFDSAQSREELFREQSEKSITTDMARALR